MDMTNKPETKAIIDGILGGISFLPEEKVGEVKVTFDMGVTGKLKELGLKQLEKHLHVYMDKLGLEAGDFNIHMDKGSLGLVQFNLSTKNLRVVISPVTCWVMPSNLYHELVHIAQMKGVKNGEVEGELKSNGDFVYKGVVANKEVISDTKRGSAYWYLPSEEEAYRAQLAIQSPVVRWLNKVTLWCQSGRWF